MCEQKFLVLFKGDDSDCIGSQQIVVTLQTELDLTGCKAHFRFLDFKIDFDEIPSDKKLALIFPATETAKFPLGMADADLWIEDANHKKRTVSNRIHIVVTRSVKEAYDNDSPQAISVIISGGDVTWEQVKGKPFSSFGAGIKVNDGVASINTPSVSDIAAFDLTSPSQSEKTAFLRLVKAYILAKEA